MKQDGIKKPKKNEKKKGHEPAYLRNECSSVGCTENLIKKSSHMTY